MGIDFSSLYVYIKLWLLEWRKEEEEGDGGGAAPPLPNQQNGVAMMEACSWTCYQGGFYFLFLSSI